MNPEPLPTLFTRPTWTPRPSSLETLARPKRACEVTALPPGEIAFGDPHETEKDTLLVGGRAPEHTHVESAHREVDAVEAQSHTMFEERGF